jgi:hypothetical protein
MAVSLGFGVMFSTFVTLFLVPALYLAVEDARRLMGYRREEAQAAAVTASESAS